MPEREPGAIPTDDPRPTELRRAPSLVLVNTGPGKGKTTAAMGVVMRGVGRGWPVAVVQFLKSGDWHTGEEEVCCRLGVDWWSMGDGFTWDSTDLSVDQAIAADAWAHARRLIGAGDHRLVVLDEITYPINWEWIDVDDVVATISTRPSRSTSCSPARRPVGADRPRRHRHRDGRHQARLRRGHPRRRRASTTDAVLRPGSHTACPGGPVSPTPGVSIGGPAEKSWACDADQSQHARPSASAPACWRRRRRRPSPLASPAAAVTRRRPRRRPRRSRPWTDSSRPAQTAPTHPTTRTGPLPCRRRSR